MADVDTDTRIEGGAVVCRHCNNVLTFNFIDRPAGPCPCRLRAEAEAQRQLDHHRRESIIQHPETGDFLRGALVEAAYQREAWPDQDEAKSDSDWFWTLGYIVGKATKEHDPERQLHHIEAGAALLANWHNAVKGRG